MTIEHAKSALAAFDADRDQARQWLAAGIWTSDEREVVRAALLEYIERHKPYVPEPDPPSVEEQFAELRAKYPTATLTPHPEHAKYYLVTIKDWPLPPGYDRHHCDVFFVVPNGYPYVPPDRFFTSELRMESRATPYMSRPLKVEPYEAHGHTWQGEGMHPFPADAGSMIWFWKVTSWHGRQNTLKTYANVIKARLDNVTAGDRRHHWDD
jgi:hypothetical protein